MYWENRAIARRLAGQWDEAFADYDKAVELSPSAERYNARGDGHYYHDDYERAIADFTMAIQLEPENTLYLENRGISYRLAGKYGAALRDLDKCINLEQQNASHYNARGHVYYNLENYDKAVADYTQAITLAPGNSMYFEFRGNARRLWATQNLENAEELWSVAFTDYDEAIRLDPQNAERHNARGNGHHARGEYDAAIVDYDKAIELDPATQTYSSNRNRSRRDRHWLEARRLREAGEFDAAISQADQMLAIELEWLGPDDVETAISVEWIATAYKDAALAALPANAAEGSQLSGVVDENLARAERDFKRPSLGGSSTTARTTGGRSMPESR